MEKLKDFWNGKTSEERRKIIVYSIAGVVSFFLILIVYLVNNPNKTEMVSEMDNPDAKEAQKYNSRTEANQLGKVDSTNMNTAMDDLFGNSTEPIDKNIMISEPEYVEPVYTQPNYNNNSNSRSSKDGSYSSGGGGSYNSHNTYGDYSMWQTQEPENNSIGYTEVRNYPTKKDKNNSQKQPQANNDYSEPVSANTYVQPSYGQEALRKGKNVRAKLISQGYVTSGRSLSFVLLENTKVSGVDIKKGAIVTGVSQEQNGRLLVSFSNIKVNDKLIPAEMALIGSDGVIGLPISGSGSGSNIGGSVVNEVRSQAGGIISRVPIVGGVLSSVATNKNSRGDNSDAIKLGSNITCYIAIY